MSRSQVRLYRQSRITSLDVDLFDVVVLLVSSFDFLIAGQPALPGTSNSAVEARLKLNFNLVVYYPGGSSKADPTLLLLCCEPIIIHVSVRPSNFILYRSIEGDSDCIIIPFRQQHYQHMIKSLTVPLSRRPDEYAVPGTRKYICRGTAEFRK